MPAQRPKIETPRDLLPRYDVKTDVGVMRRSDEIRLVAYLAV